MRPRETERQKVRDRRRARRTEREKERQRHRDRDTGRVTDRETHDARGRQAPDTEGWVPWVEVKGGPDQAGEPGARLER